MSVCKETPGGWKADPPHAHLPPPARTPAPTRTELPGAFAAQRAAARGQDLCACHLSQQPAAQGDDVSVAEAGVPGTWRERSPHPVRGGRARSRGAGLQPCGKPVLSVHLPLPHTTRTSRDPPAVSPWAALSALPAPGALPAPFLGEARPWLMEPSSRGISLKTT